MPARPWLRRAKARLGAALRPGPAGPDLGAGAAGVVESSEQSEEVALLVGSRLFDHEWYQLCLDRRLSREAAVRHYLRRGSEQGLTPHPLFAPDHYASSSPTTRRDPLVAYLREQDFEAPVHPLFDVAAYLAANPDAAEHPAGPVGHYSEVGAAAGARPNSWFVPGPSRPRGLVDLLFTDARTWAANRRTALPTWGRRPAPAATAPATSDTTATAPTPVTSVVLVLEFGGEHAARSIASVLAQSSPAWELLVHTVRGGVSSDQLDLGSDDRVRIDPEVHPDRWTARNRGLELASGSYVTWMLEGDVWLPGRLATLQEQRQAHGWRWWHDCARDERPLAARRHASRPTTRSRLEAGIQPELGTMVVERSLARTAGGFDTTLPAAHVFDLALRLVVESDPGFVDRLGVLVERGAERAGLLPERRGWLLGEKELADRATETVLNRHLVPWDRLSTHAERPGSVSVVLVASDGAASVQDACTSLLDEPLGEGDDIVVVDNGAGLVTSGVVASLAERSEHVSLLRLPVDRGVALATNLALSHAQGEVLVLLDHAKLLPHWRAPLVGALGRRDVLAVQPLQVQPDRTVAAAGLAFASTTALPHHFLRGFPVEDAAGLESQTFHALSGAALGVRRADLLAVRGLDPQMRHSMYDADLCLRLAQHRDGSCAVAPAALAVHDPGELLDLPPGRGGDHLLFLRRWWGRLPTDEGALWGSRGLGVSGHHVVDSVSRDNRACVQQPLLVRADAIAESPPVMRWAIKCAAPFGPDTERWGDIHFARHLAAALRSIGQHVAIDHQQAFNRGTGWFDDVRLTLRGLTPFGPPLEGIDLLWVISHPDLVTRAEVAGYDRVYVASTTYARALSAEWGVEVRPLLQATDPTVFHPDLAEPDSGHELLFVGNSRNHVRPLVVGAADLGLPLAVFGGDWEQFIPSAMVQGRYLPNVELGAAYRAAKVVLNDHWADMHENGFLSNRLFDAVASGARVVSDDAAGLHEVFGDAVRSVADAQELARLVTAPDLDAVFGSDEVRRQRAARVADEHSFTARAEVLVEAAARARAGGGTSWHG